MKVSFEILTVFGVGPVDVIDGVIDGESVGPHDVIGDEDAPIAAVQIGAFDARLLPPIRPHDDGSAGVDGDGARFLHVLLEQRPAHRSVQERHLDTPHARIRPVDGVVDPIDGHSAGAFQSAPGHVAHHRPVHIGALDGVQRHVGPDDDPFGMVKVQRDGVLQAVNHRCVFFVEQRHLSVQHWANQTKTNLRHFNTSVASTFTAFATSNSNQIIPFNILDLNRVFLIQMNGSACCGNEIALGPVTFRIKKDSGRVNNWNWDLADVHSVGENEPDRITGGLTRRHIRTEDVTGGATAAECAHRVGAQLAAQPLRRALVDVGATDAVFVELVTAAAPARVRPVRRRHASVLAPARRVALLLECAVQFVLSARTILSFKKWMNQDAISTLALQTEIPSICNWLATVTVTDKMKSNRTQIVNQNDYLIPCEWKESPDHFLLEHNLEQIKNVSVINSDRQWISIQIKSHFAECFERLTTIIELIQSQMNRKWISFTSVSWSKKNEPCLGNSIETLLLHHLDWNQIAPAVIFFLNVSSNKSEWINWEKN